jgi:hypothetical protein
MAYTDIDKADDYFNTVLYTGDGTTARSITGVGFQPDWLWVKSRSTTYYHGLWDVVRTNKSALYSNASDAEDTTTGGTLTSFDSDGFTLPNVSGGFVNNSGTTYVAWNWLANGAGVSNTAGSISSTVSASTTSGFSIVSWTGTGSGATIGHGLGVKPKMIIVKNRDSAATNWVVNVGEILGVDERSLYLNTTTDVLLDAQATTGYTYSNQINTFATASGSSGNQNDVNESGSDMIAYCFADVKGFSKFGSYVGNGSADGTFVYTGFKPAYFLLKQSSASGEDWVVQDNKRDTFNPVDATLYASASNAENSGYRYCDFNANGFKIRNSQTDYNQSGATYIYMAFAESPFVTSTSVPTTAR